MVMGVALPEGSTRQARIGVRVTLILPIDRVRAPGSRQSICSDREPEWGNGMGSKQ